MKAYISCPLGESIIKVQQVVGRLISLGYKPTYFIRGTPYEDKDVRDCDLFVLISSGGEFDFKVAGMTEGCKKELLLASSLGKSLHLAYWKANTELNIYDIGTKQLAEGRVMGMSKHYLQPFKKSEIINNYSIY